MPFGESAIPMGPINAAKIQKNQWIATGIPNRLKRR